MLHPEWRFGGWVSGVLAICGLDMGEIWLGSLVRCFGL